MKKNKKSVKVLNFIIVGIVVLVFVFYCFSPNLAGKDLDTNVICRSGPVNGPSEVSLAHPVVTITMKNNSHDFWIEITSPNGQKNIVSYSDEIFSGEKIVMDGWVGDIQGNSETMIFIPGEYVVKGYVHPRQMGLPFDAYELVYRTTFVVPNCEAR